MLTEPPAKRQGGFLMSIFRRVQSIGQAGFYYLLPPAVLLAEFRKNRGLVLAPVF